MSDQKERALERIRDAAASGSNLLDLREIGLTELPDELWELTQLTTLTLRENQLTGVPEAISRLTNLTHLYLEMNQLTEVPEAISRLTNLTYLNLDSNQLTEVPEAIFGLTKVLFKIKRWMSYIVLDCNACPDPARRRRWTYGRTWPLHTQRVCPESKRVVVGLPVEAHVEHAVGRWMPKPTFESGSRHLRQ